MTLTEIRDEAASLLCAQPFFAEYKIIAEYPGAARQLPLKSPLLVVGIDKIELGAGAMGGYFGESGGNVPTGPYGEITLRLDVLLPQNMNFPARLAEEIFACIFANMGAQRLWCSEISRDKAAMASCRRFYLSFSALLYSAGDDESETFGELIIRKV